jgi:thioredoxin 1
MTTMRGRAWLVLVVILAVVAVFAAKEAIKERPAATMRGADSRPQEAAPGAPAHPSAEGKPEGPLPGSKLAECLKSGRPTMADFGKGWCQPCKMMVPVLKQAAQDYWGKANIVFVELDEYAELGGNYRIAAMPTQVFFDAKGKEVSRHMGYMGTEDIERELAALGVKR